jgi:hypothetical protein
MGRCPRRRGQSPAPPLRPALTPHGSASLRPERYPAATVAAWVGAFTNATFYTGLDNVAGVAAGVVVRDAGGADVGRPVQALFTTGDALRYCSPRSIRAGSDCWPRPPPTSSPGTCPG